MSTTDSTLTSFIDIKADSDFSIHNLPYGIFSDTKDSARVRRVTEPKWWALL